jgi:hypothetical protein
MVVILGQWISGRYEWSRQRRAEAAEVNLRYLNPLRLQVAETAFRHDQYVATVERRGSQVGISPVATPEEVSGKSPDWFVGEGCYLVSTAYIVACLFAEMAKLREGYAYLRLPDSAADTELATLVLRVNIAFLRDQGVYYAIQYSIGRDMRLEDGRLIGYREFCERLRDPTARVWFDRLLGFYIQAGRPDQLERLHRADRALLDLGAALDRAVGGSTSLAHRFAAEGESPRVRGDDQPWVG